MTTIGLVGGSDRRGGPFDVRRWLTYARQDLTAAECLRTLENVPPTISCFWAQQAAEKSLKAALIYCTPASALADLAPILVPGGVYAPYVHDLDNLRDKIPDGWAVKKQFPSLSDLTRWVIQARYPDGLADATEEDARHSLKQARAVFESIAADLRSRGFDFEES